MWERCVSYHVDLFIQTPNDNINQSCCGVVPIWFDTHLKRGEEIISEYIGYK